MHEERGLVVEDLVASFRRAVQHAPQLLEATILRPRRVRPDAQAAVREARRRPEGQLARMLQMVEAAAPRQHVEDHENASDEERRRHRGRGGQERHAARRAARAREHGLAGRVQHIFLACLDALDVRFHVGVRGQRHAPAIGPDDVLAGRERAEAVRPAVGRLRVLCQEISEERPLRSFERRAVSIVHVTHAGAGDAQRIEHDELLDSRAKGVLIGPLACQESTHLHRCRSTGGRGDMHDVSTSMAMRLSTGPDPKRNAWVQRQPAGSLGLASGL